MQILSEKKTALIGRLDEVNGRGGASDSACPIDQAVCTTGCVRPTCCDCTGVETMAEMAVVSPVPLDACADSRSALASLDVSASLGASVAS